MNDDPARLAAAIGARVRRQRQSHGWTLDRLAQAAGVSRRMLVNVEKGDANPSVGTLLKISDALEVALPVLVEPPQPAALKITRRVDGSVLWRGEAGGSGTLVAGSGPPDIVELWDWSLESGDRHDSTPHPAGTQELLHVIHGELTVELAEQVLSLDEGDALALSADISHSYLNEAADVTRFSMAVFVPGRPGELGRPVDG